MKIFYVMHKSSTLRINDIIVTIKYHIYVFIVALQYCSWEETRASSGTLWVVDFFLQHCSISFKLFLKNIFSV